MTTKNKILYGIIATGICGCVGIAVWANAFFDTKTVPRTPITSTYIEEGNTSTENIDEVDTDSSANSSQSETSNAEVQSSKPHNTTINTPAASGSSPKPQEYTYTPITVDTTPEPEVEKPKTVCIYKRMYGNKTPAELASESYMVSYYYNQMIEAENVYREAVTMYSSSGSDQFRYKIVQAEFAMNKAKTLYNNEYSSQVEKYQQMLNECEM